MKKTFLILAALCAGLCAFAQGTDWYPSETANKAFVRWWWQGSAVDIPGLTYNLEEFAKAGLGGVEITPIYGVQGNEANDIPFLSDKWMEMYEFTVSKSDSLGLQVDMNCGTGWPFGGPEITPGLAAQRMKIEGDTIVSVQTGQLVKRAAPGGEGFVMDHYNADALKTYLAKFDEAFSRSGAPQPYTWFNDSYEVYGADWTSGFPEYFRSRYGYDIVPYLADPSREDYLRAICDYRECLGTMLKENFLDPWTEWVHAHGAKVRNQSHGSPANILDFYATVDIPECETFGRTEFDIPRLRKDPITRRNDGDPMALKFASSAAHLKGKKYVSAETLTWLTEHFRTSLSQCKPELDQAFCAGVNHIYFHGAPYSPYGAEFPGWCFYAAINMSPTGGMWRDAPAFFKYIERCQAFLTAGEPDGDFLLYVPIYDAWSMDTGKPYMMFDIHGMDKTLPSVKHTMKQIMDAGFDADYISDKLLAECDITRPLIVPSCKFMPVETARRIVELMDSGATVYFLDGLPDDVPGLSDLKSRRKQFRRIAKRFPQPVSMESALSHYRAEEFRTSIGGSMIRRRNEAGGWNYFLSMLADHTVDGWVRFATPAASAMIFNPLDGSKGKAQTRTAADGCVEIRLQMEPGQSLLVKTFAEEITGPCWSYVASAGQPLTLDRGWSITFPESAPAIGGAFPIAGPMSWTELDVAEAKVNHATACYSTTIMIDDMASADEWILDLGDVRESAEVVVNGNKVATLFSVPFKTPVGKWLKPGANTLDVYVTNLQSNRIADYERRGVKWRIFKDANINSITGASKFSFGGWNVDPSGLVSPVTLIPVRLDNSQK